MSAVSVGSYALSQLFPGEIKPKDKDYFLLDKDTPQPESEDELRVEAFHSPRFRMWDWGESATLDELYTIKISHFFWDQGQSWDKHAYYIVFMENKGATFIPELYDILYPIWEGIHGKKKANLEASPEEFFNENVPRIYDHDSIHASVAYYDEPLFNRILRDNSEVAVSKNKFNALTHEDKLKLVREEVYATALERRGIPSDYKEHHRKAYDYALKKTLTSFTKGWFPLFIALHYSELRKPDHNYYKTHHANKDMLVRL